MKQIKGPLYRDKAGLYFEPGQFYLDPLRAVECGIVSHAHFDHFCKGIKNVYAEPVTCRLMDLRVKGFPGNLHPVAFRTPFKINGVTVTLFPAGHILGSSMVLIEHNGIRYLYTGDFKTAPDPTCETFEAVAADVLICESTYADKSVTHPHESELIKQLTGLQSANVIIGAYVLGKAQRLTEMLCRVFQGRQVMVHPDIIPYHHLYEHHNIELGSWKPYDYGEFRNSNDTFFVVPPRVLTTFGRQGHYHTLMASSYAGNYSRMPLLRLSDHADWNGFEKLVSEVQPATIISIHGDGSGLSKLESAHELLLH